MGGRRSRATSGPIELINLVASVSLKTATFPEDSTMAHRNGLGAATEAGKCPPCGETLPTPAESRPIVPASEDLIASWLTPAGPPEPPRASDGECRACGYSGDMGA